MFAFSSSLRKKSLFAADDRNNSLLRLKDVSFPPEGLILRVKVIKTSMFLDNELHLPIPEVPKNVLCPVKAFKILRVTPGLRKHHALFFIVLREVKWLVPLKAELFVTNLRKIMLHVGYEPSAFSVHSFRKGAATLANFCGIAAGQFKAHGNWRSDCFEEYIVRDDQLRDAFSRAIKEKLSLGVFGG